MTHPNYYEDDFNGQPVWRCCQCEYDSFSLGNIEGHVASHGIKELPLADEDLILDRKKKIMIGFLTWNTEEATAYTATRFASEVIRLQEAGIDAESCWVDNGSTDGTQHDATLNDFVDHTFRFDQNCGQSVARNKIIGRAIKSGADYLMLVDGDIAVIPNSAYAMANYMEKSQEYRRVYTIPVGCVGLYSRNCTRVHTLAASACASLTGLCRPDPHMAWTQYGMFDMRMFRLDGICFDEAPCFQGPGWGFEDDDLGLQMLNTGWASANSRYFTYLHRNLHSGLSQLPPTLAAKVMAERKEYVYNKWKDNPKTSAYVERMRNQTPPVLTITT